MRMLHTMLRVGDLEQSIAFYTEVLGMQLLRRKDYPTGRFTLAFLGYGPESDHTVLESLITGIRVPMSSAMVMAISPSAWRTSTAPVRALPIKAAGWCGSPGR